MPEEWTTNLLGGAWVGEQGFEKEVGDSIYTAFVLQEAVRLAKRARGEENALINYSATSGRTNRNSLSPIQLFH